MTAEIEEVVDGIRRATARLCAPYERSITATTELWCPACYDLRAAWRDALDAFLASADTLIAAVQGGDRAAAEMKFEPFSEAMTEVTVAESAFVRHLDNHLKGKPPHNA